MSKIPSLALCFCLVPFSSGFADDNETELLHNNPYQANAQDSCGGTAGQCTITFPPTSHSITQITQVACFFSAPSGSQVNYAFIRDDGSFNQFYLQPFVFSVNGDGTTNFGINSQTGIFVNKGKSPLVVIYVSGGVPNSYNCSISGFHS